MNEQPFNENELAAPPKLVKALRNRKPEPLFIPPTVDSAVLTAARRHLERPQRARFNWFRLVPSLAAAMVLAVLLVVTQFIVRRVQSRGSLARQDLNHDGKVDILDAFALARQLKSGVVSRPELDINGDGVVDERDAAALAAQAVKLDKGGRS